jgi:hypothetical protein
MEEVNNIPTQNIILETVNIPPAIFLQIITGKAMEMQNKEYRQMLNKLNRASIVDILESTYNNNSIKNIIGECLIDVDYFKDYDKSKLIECLMLIKGEYVKCITINPTIGTIKLREDIHKFFGKSYNDYLKQIIQTPPEKPQELQYNELNELKKDDVIKASQCMYIKCIQLEKDLYYNLNIGRKLTKQLEKIRGTYHNFTNFVASPEFESDVIKQNTINSIEVKKIQRIANNAFTAVMDKDVIIMEREAHIVDLHNEISEYKQKVELVRTQWDTHIKLLDEEHKKEIKLLKQNNKTNKSQDRVVFEINKKQNNKTNKSQDRLVFEINKKQNRICELENMLEIQLNNNDNTTRITELYEKTKHENIELHNSIQKENILINQLQKQNKQIIENNNKTNKALYERITKITKLNTLINKLQEENKKINCQVLSQNILNNFINKLKKELQYANEKNINNNKINEENIMINNKYNNLLNTQTECIDDKKYNKLLNEHYELVIQNTNLQKESTRQTKLAEEKYNELISEQTKLTEENISIRENYKVFMNEHNYELKENQRLNEELIILDEQVNNCCTKNNKYDLINKLNYIQQISEQIKFQVS